MRAECLDEFCFVVLIGAVVLDILIYLRATDCPFVEFLVVDELDSIPLLAFEQVHIKEMDPANPYAVLDCRIVIGIDPTQALFIVICVENQFWNR